jgi:glycosyltransferase involved in cell wall biosynthesis
MPTIIFADPHIIGETIGGAEVQLWMLARGFSEADWEAHYVTDAQMSEVDREGVTIHSLANYNTVQYKDKFLSILDSIKPDIIYQRGRKSYTGLAGDYAANTGTPFIFATSMDIDCRHFKEAGRLLQQSMSLAAKVRLLPRRVRQDISSLGGMKKASLILAQSELQNNLLKKNLGMESIIFRNLHPVPDEKKIVKDHPPLILWLASVKQWKRPELFLELAESLKEKKYRFILAGRLADRTLFENRIKNYVVENPHFQYIENIDLEQSNDLIASASIFVNTSEPFEGFPNTFIQSWLRKTVVFSLCVDPDHLISKFNIGKLSGDLKSMSEQIASLLDEPKLLKDMGHNARKFSIKEFGFSENFGRIEKLARNLINQKNGDETIKEMLD